MAISPEFGTAGAAATAVLAAYLLLADPWIGRRMYASLERRRDSEPRALVRYFALVTVLWWLAAALAGAALLAADDVAASDVGLGAPESPWYAALLCALLVVGAVVTGRSLRRLHAEGRSVPGLSTIAAMLPRTPAERRIATVAAVTDGLCAEFVYRGLLIAFGVGVLGLNVYVAAAISLAAYALAGLYQGRRGVLAFAVFGAIATMFYLVTGSLLVPVVFHVVMTVRDLAFIPVPPRERRSGAHATL
ncbi:CPBP family intramembrane metalloprotease [Streptomyces sp. TRM66268-LWL]|uniref:CPBP family intramembrane metalloprotease n=1 Tax=Streptomyces polyasparticus TaxID=2767826 RepID=A0ABR7SR04_9ACTN|nr:CPBP family glutamic-type intramembrane protease [Streptomyces polyasparticus]MBC9717935.1 CPBP family intramembrane metalloprotease [Streptomyces polyasparticus]